MGDVWLREFLVRSELASPSENFSKIYVFWKLGDRLYLVAFDHLGFAQHFHCKEFLGRLQITISTF